MEKYGYNITKSEDGGILNVYPPFICVGRCPGCPSIDRFIFNKNPLGVQFQHIIWYIEHLGNNAETVYVTGSDTNEYFSAEQILHMSRSLSQIYNQRMIIETCGVSGPIFETVKLIDQPNLCSIHLRLLGSLDWYEKTFFDMFIKNQFSGDEKGARTATSNRLYFLCENVNALHTETTALRKLGSDYGFITYLRPDMTLQELDLMAEQFKLRGNKKWILEPFIDCSVPGELILNKVSNLDEVLRITGASYRESRYSNDCTRETTITLKGEVLCANAQESKSNSPQSNSIATTEPSLSSSEEVNSQQDLTSEAANTQ